jgi:hypothetical protein
MQVADAAGDDYHGTRAAFELAMIVMMGGTGPTFQMVSTLWPLHMPTCLLFIKKIGKD